MSDPSNPNDPTSTSTVETPSSTPAVEPAANPAQPTDPNSLFADQLAGIKTDDGRQKYADVQTALDSIPHAQTHIADQSAKIKELEEELAKRQGMEQVLEQLQSQQAVTETPSEQTGVADQIDVAALIDAKLREKEVMDTQVSNQNKVLTELGKQFGETAESAFNAKAAELGVSVGFLSDLARKAPEAVLAYFGKAQASPQPVSQGSVNTSVLDGQPAQENNDHMKIFQPESSDTMKKWRASGDAITPKT